MATHSSILAWRIPWTEEPGELHGLQRVGYVTEVCPEVVLFMKLGTHMLIVLFFYLAKIFLI